MARRRPAGDPVGGTQRNRLAVAAAVLELLGQGVVDFTVTDVADRAGIHRSTIYRRWPSRLSLLREALGVHTASLGFSESGKWSEDLPAMVGALASFFARPAEVAMNATMAARTDASMAEVLVEHWGPVLADLDAVVRRAQDRGEVAAGIDPQAIVAMAVSPLLVTTTFLRRAPTQHEVEQVTEVLRSATMISDLRAGAAPVAAAQRGGSAQPERRSR